MIWTTSNGLGLRRSDIMDTPRRSIHLGMMITTAIPGMFATPIPTCDRSADHNDDRNFNCENMTPTPRTITTMILIAITIPIPVVIGMLIPRMIAISTQEVMTAPISRTVTITISVRIMIAIPIASATGDRDHDYDRGRGPNLDPDIEHMVPPKWYIGINDVWKPVPDIHGTQEMPDLLAT
ncbi:unnamed protein product [Phytophthora fragariaefolia]|uniref:Unnamed protein product n=1 Tax=Phytophthora fragariaefolia TaxID=1490495 RepID=A0A9W6Y7R3_9STRA|nr:unnamed protein product [Phytophthora fragariaefolia]